MMKFITIFIFFTLSSIAMMAQSPISIGLSSSYLQNNRMITSFNSEYYKDYRDMNESALSGLDIGLSVMYRLNSKFNIGTGLRYTQNGYKVNEDRIIDPCYSPITCGYTYDLYEYSYQYIGIPISINYRSPHKLFFTYSAGVSFLLSISDNLNYVVRKESKRRSDQKKISIENLSDHSPINISLDLKAGIGYRVTDNWFVLLQPVASALLIPQENTHFRDRIYNIGKFVDVDKTTVEHFYSYGINIQLIYSSFGSNAL